MTTTTFLTFITRGGGGAEIIGADFIIIGGGKVFMIGGDGKNLIIGGDAIIGASKPPIKPGAAVVATTKTQKHA